MSDKENKTGFESIGKRISNLKDEVVHKGSKKHQKKDNQPDLSNSGSHKQENIPEDPHVTNTTTDSTLTPKSSLASPRHKFLSFLSIKRILIFIAIIVVGFLIFQENSNKGKFRSYLNKKKSIQKTTSRSPSNNNLITVGQYRCSRYHNNKARTLKPSITEKVNMDGLDHALTIESKDLERLNKQLKATHINNYSQESVDNYNALVNEYNSKLELLTTKDNNLQARYNRYNSQVKAYNRYLSANCKKAY